MWLSAGVVTPATFRPHAEWVTGQACACLQHPEQRRLRRQTFDRDLDGKFSAAFDLVFADREIRVKPVGPRASSLNAFVDRWLQSLEQKALNYFVVFGLGHVDQIAGEFVEYYIERRPHQAIGNRLIKPPEGVISPVVHLDQLACEGRLGGLRE